MLDDAKPLGGEPYLYYSRNALHNKLEISRNKEKSSDMYRKYIKGKLIKLLASVLKIYRSNKIYKFVSTGTVSISTRQKR